MESFWTLLALGFGLTLSVLITAAQHQLPLAHAIIAMNLIYLANVTQIFVLYIHVFTSSNPSRSSHYALSGATLQNFFATACMIYIWAIAAKLDNILPHEDATVFVFFFAPIPALKAGRTLSITLLAISCGAGLPTLIKQTQTGRLPMRRPRAELRGNCAVSAWIFIPGFLYVVMLGSTERQIHLNNFCPGNNSWTFGQILALTAAVPPIVEIVRIWLPKEEDEEELQSS